MKSLLIDVYGTSNIAKMFLIDAFQLREEINEKIVSKVESLKQNIWNTAVEHALSETQNIYTEFSEIALKGMKVSSTSYANMVRLVTCNSDTGNKKSDEKVYKRREPLWMKPLWSKETLHFFFST
jgi:hypothetical protein